MLFNQNFYTYYCKERHLNILIVHGDTKGDTGLLGQTVEYYTFLFHMIFIIYLTLAVLCGNVSKYCFFFSIIKYTSL